MEKLTCWKVNNVLYEDVELAQRAYNYQVLKQISKKFGVVEHDFMEALVRDDEMMLDVYEALTDMAGEIE